MREILEADLPPLFRTLFAADLEAVAGDLIAVVAETVLGVGRRFSGALREYVERAEACLTLARRLTDARRLLAARFASLQQGLSAAETDGERQDLLITYLELFTPPDRIAGDREAFERFFGLDAVTERTQRLQEVRARREEILLTAAAHCVRKVVRNVLRGPGAEGEARALVEARRLVEELAIEAYIREQVQSSPRWQSRVAALRALGRIAHALPARERAHALRVETRNALVRAALDRDETVWVQREALALVASLPLADAGTVVANRLTRDAPRAGDDIFCRAFAVKLARGALGERAGVALLGRVLAGRDPSELVRMEAARALAKAPSLEAERLLLTAVRGAEVQRDPSPRVRSVIAGLWRESAGLDDAHEEMATRTLAWLIRRDPDPLVQRIACEEAMALAADRQRRQRRYKVDARDFELLAAFDEVARTHEDVALRRSAEEARERIVVRTLAAYDWVESRIAEPLRALDEHGQLSLAARDLAVPEEVLGRVLASFTIDGFGVMIERVGERYIFRKGDRFRRRLWRILFELRHPDPAKRQAHLHTLARLPVGHLRVPPGRLGELVETKVPGERLWIGAERSWRRFLPTVDDYLSAFSLLPWRRQRLVHVFSSEGRTTITDGRPWWQALRGYLRMSWRYRELAQLRNAGPHDPRTTDRSAFLRCVDHEFGFETSFHPARFRYENEEYVLLDDTLLAHFRDATVAVGGSGDDDMERFAARGAAAASDGALSALERESGAVGGGADTIAELLQPLLGESGSGSVTMSERSAGSFGTGSLGEDLEELDAMAASSVATPAQSGDPDETHAELRLEVTAGGAVLGAELEETAGEDLWASGTAEWMGETGDAQATRSGPRLSRTDAPERTGALPSTGAELDDTAPQPEPVYADGDDTAPQPEPVYADGDDTAPQPKPVYADGDGDDTAPQPEPAYADGDDTAPQPKPVYADGDDTAPQPEPVYADGDDTAPLPKPARAEGHDGEGTS